MQTYKAVIAYDGSAFCGFSLQKHKPSVLGALQEAFGRLGVKSEILGASRTDKGVHATRQVICFKNAHLHTYDERYLCSLLNAKLYPHISLHSLKPVQEGFHPRFDAKWRAYRFLLSNKLPSPFASAYITYAKIGDILSFKSALSLFRGKHDFSFFKKNGSYTKDNIRTLFHIRHYQHKGIDIVYMCANGFLRSQVRLMVGAALSVSRGEMSIEDLNKQLLCKQQYYSYPLNPQGLYLCGVGY